MSEKSLDKEITRQAEKIVQNIEANVEYERSNASAGISLRKIVDLVDDIQSQKNSRLHNVKKIRSMILDAKKEERDFYDEIIQRNRERWQEFAKQDLSEKLDYQRKFYDAEEKCRKIRHEKTEEISNVRDNLRKVISSQSEKINELDRKNREYAITLAYYKEEIERLQREVISARVQEEEGYRPDLSEMPRPTNYPYDDDVPF